MCLWLDADLVGTVGGSLSAVNFVVLGFLERVVGGCLGIVVIRCGIWERGVLESRTKSLGLMTWKRRGPS